MITQFWLNDPSILFKNKHILELWPTLAMSKEEKLNAITRIVIMLSALGYIITGSSNFIIVDNNDAGEDVFKKVWKRCMILVKKKVNNTIAKSWISKQLRLKKR